MSEEQTHSDNELEKYIHEIDECGKPIVQKLSTIMGKKNVARYLSHLDKHNALADRTPPVHSQSGAVLCRDDIEAFCNCDLPLIDYPDKLNTKIEAASYQLRLGSRCRVVDPKVGDSQGIVWLTDTRKDLHIRPHGIVIVSTYEWLNMPGCLIGRWNLKVKKVYDGLVWVGSLQVDPGYQGFLFCPIYNLSNEEQILIYKDPLFIIDFVLTTPNKEGKYDIWQIPPDRDRYSTFDFDRLDEKRIKSAPQESFDDIERRITRIEQLAEETKDNLKNRVEESKNTLETKMERYFQINLVLISIIIAALAIISGFGLGSVIWDESWMPLVIAVFAFAVSIIAIVISFRVRKRK